MQVVEPTQDLGKVVKFIAGLAVFNYVGAEVDQLILFACAHLLDLGSSFQVKPVEVSGKVLPGKDRKVLGLGERIVVVKSLKVEV